MGIKASRPLQAAEGAARTCQDPAALAREAEEAWVEPAAPETRSAVDRMGKQGMTRHLQGGGGGGEGGCSSAHQKGEQGGQGASLLFSNNLFQQWL